MKVHDLNWMQLDRYLEQDDRVVLPLGSTEQHGYLSLGVDHILAERMAVEAAQPLGIPVFPGLPYGLAPYFTGFPGTVSLREETYVAIFQDILDSLASSGFKRILVVNGHGGNRPAADSLPRWLERNPGVQVRFHNWWNAPRTWATVQEIDPAASHASWMENFPWTRLPGVVPPTERKPMVDRDRVHALTPPEAREYLGDGSYGGYYERSDEEVLAVWAAGVEETRAVLEGGWE
jgi:creatinine amidohydrolase